MAKEQYESWVRKVLRPEKYAEVVSSFGEFPGEYMATGDGRLGVARLQFFGGCRQAVYLIPFFLQMQQ